MATQPVRIAPDLLSSAEKAGARAGRTMAQQIAHWVRIGRELDASASLTVARAQQISAAAYDQLAPEQQAVVRVLWENEIDERIATLELGRRFAGRDYVVAGDETGAAIKVPPPAPPRAKKAPAVPKSRKATSKKATARSRVAAKRG